MGTSWEILGVSGRLPEYLINLMFIQFIKYWDLLCGRFWEFLGDSGRFYDGFFDSFSSLEISSNLVQALRVPCCSILLCSCCDAGPVPLFQAYRRDVTVDES